MLKLKVFSLKVLTEHQFKTEKNDFMKVGFGIHKSFEN